jgi:hypothetical protein
MLEWFQNAIDQRCVELFENLQVDDTDAIALRGELRLTDGATFRMVAFLRIFSE